MNAPIDLPETDRIYVPARISLRSEGENGPTDGPKIVVGIAGVCNQSALIREEIEGEVLTFRESFAPRAFRSVIANGQDTIALVNHDDNLILGRVASGTLRLWEEPNGDLGTEIILPDTSYGRDVAVSLARGDYGGMSIGFLPDPDSLEWSDDRTSVRIASVAVLRDVSIVTKPAYRGTRAALRSYRSTDAAPRFPPRGRARVAFAGARLRALNRRLSRD